MKYIRVKVGIWKYFSISISNVCIWSQSLWLFLKIVLERQVMSHGLLKTTLRPRGVAPWELSLTTESLNEEIAYQINADLIFWQRRIVYKQFVAEVETVKLFIKTVFLEIFRKSIIHMISNIVDNWMSDKAQYHTALSITEFLTSKDISMFPQPLYLPDLSHCDFSWTKTTLKGITRRSCN